MKKRKIAEWRRLENAAKIFPSTSDKNDTKVFRFSCELKEDIDAECLTGALNKTLEHFPFYLSILRRGLFWYYFEHTDILPVIKKEDSPPCSPIYFSNKKTLLFEVTYYKKRINLEIYHALTDGTGALQFLKVMVYYYISIKYAEDFPNGFPELDYDASLSDREDDSFQKYYSKVSTVKPVRPVKAFHIQGPKFSEHRIGIIEGSMSVKQLLEKAHEYKTTVTSLLASLLLCSIYKEMPVRQQKFPVVITIPVNLRNYFSSESARNFFGTFSISYNFKEQSPELKDVISYVDKLFKKELQKDEIIYHMNSILTLEHNIFARAVPLIIKDVALNIANRMFENSVTGALSNIGKISMPKEFSAYINLFDVFISTSKLQICMCSYEDNLQITFSTPFESSNIQKNFFRSLSKMGIDITISANQLEKDL